MWGKKPMQAYDPGFVAFATTALTDTFRDIASREPGTTDIGGCDAMLVGYQAGGSTGAAWSMSTVGTRRRRPSASRPTG